MNTIRLFIAGTLVSLACISCARSSPEDDFEKAADRILEVEPAIAKILDKDSSVEGVAGALKTYAEAWEQFMAAAVVVNEKAKQLDAQRVNKAAKRLFEHNETQRNILFEVVRNAAVRYPTSPSILQSARTIRGIIRLVVPSQQNQPP